MKKIMFSDKFGLTKAVLEGRKTMTRRIAYMGDIQKQRAGFLIEGSLAGALVLTDNWKVVAKSRYKVGEVMAVAQSYEDIGLSFIAPPNPRWGVTEDMSGYRNKMFVLADLMPHRIRIENIKVERLQDISDEDCLREGIIKMTFDTFSFDSWKFFTHNPREAFAALIDKVSGKGTWESNPWVYAYTFKLIR